MTFREMTAEQYHADVTGDERPSLTKSLVHTLTTQSPLHAWTQHPRLNPDWCKRHEDRFDLGRAAHSVFLEGVDNIAVINARDWKAQDARDARDAARAQGKNPLLIEQAERVRVMLGVLRAWLDASPIRPALFTEGTPERSLVWEERGVLCRARFDWLHDDLTAVDDYKTTRASAHPDKWAKGALFAYGGDVQAAFYLRGLEAVTGERAAWRFVVQEVEPPYAVSVVEPGAAVLEFANRKIDAALDTWRACLNSGTWPAYPARVATAELPAWEETRWLEREVFEEAAAS